MGNIQKPRDIETRHAAIAERMGSKVKYNCDSEQQYRREQPRSF